MASFSSSSSYYALTTWSCLVGLLVLVAAHHVDGYVACPNLNKETCAFAVSSSGKRCVLEKLSRDGGQSNHVCRTSEIRAGRSRGWIESDECIDGCGVSRDTLGVSSDALLESRFVHTLCSPQCYMSCPNIVDLFFNLAAGEGVFLPKLCEAHKTNGRRAVAEIRSSGQAAPAPTVAPVHHRKLVEVAAPAPAVAFFP
ncbi:hypothetical protein EJ110_NYTH27927 [Nymphaea thermarum]|nr:hypothetical protein EJ110_NYTH27927 [Nymphaea thermarum]